MPLLVRCNAISGYFHIFPAFSWHFRIQYGMASMPFEPRNGGLK